MYTCQARPFRSRELWNIFMNLGENLKIDVCQLLVVLVPHECTCSKPAQVFAALWPEFDLICNNFYFNATNVEICLVFGILRFNTGLNLIAIFKCAQEGLIGMCWRTKSSSPLVDHLRFLLWSSYCNFWDDRDIKQSNFYWHSHETGQKWSSLLFDWGILMILFISLV